MLMTRKKQKILIVYFSQIHDYCYSKYDKKIKFLIWKYTFVNTFCFTVGLMGSIALVGVQLRQILVWAYYLIFLIFRSSQHNIACDLIRIRLEFLLNDIMHAIKMKSSIDSNMIKAKVTQFKETYQKIYDMSAIINDIGCYSLLSISILQCFSIICMGYWSLVLDFLKNIQIFSIDGEYVQILLYLELTSFLFAY